MASVAKTSWIRPEDYLERERAAQYKSEYRNGQVFAMSGASRPHNLLATNLTRLLGNQLDRPRCELYIADMRVRVQRTGSYLYPDLVVVCGGPRFEDGVFDTLLNPTVIVEILSPSTEGRDRGIKFADYREIDSLTDYILVAQDETLVERYARRDDGWAITFLRKPDEILRLESIGCEVAIRDIYDLVPMPEGGPNPPA